jgi:hypothetical protein
VEKSNTCWKKIIETKPLNKGLSKKGSLMVFDF